MKASRWIIPVVVVVVLVALFFVLKPSSPTDPAPTVAPPTATLGTPAGASPPTSTDPVVADFVVSAGTADGPRTVEVEAGRAVILNVTSDVDGEIHLHGYEILQNVKAGQTRSLSVQADAPGRFDVAFHAHEGEEVALTELEVRP